MSSSAPLIDPALFSHVVLNDDRRAIAEELQAITDPAQRYEAQVLGLLQSKYQYHKQFNCEKCWLLQRYCMCQTPMEQVASPHRLVVYMHSKEYFRSTNTVKVLMRAWPNSTLLVCGVRKHEEQLAQIIASAPSTTFALFPDPHATTVSAHRSKLEFRFPLPY
jgi:hypothetical protein